MDIQLDDEEEEADSDVRIVGRNGERRQQARPKGAERAPAYAEVGTQRSHEWRLAITEGGAVRFYRLANYLCAFFLWLACSPMTGARRSGSVSSNSRSRATVSWTPRSTTAGRRSGWAGWSLSRAIRTTTTTSSSPRRSTSEPLVSRRGLSMHTRRAAQMSQRHAGSYMVAYLVHIGLYAE